MFEELGAEILGISFDTIEENKAFAQEHGFEFRLLSDADKRVGELYMAKKKPDANFPDFPRRISYLIDPEGRIARSYKVTDVVAHPEEVLEDIKSLKT